MLLLALTVKMVLATGADQTAGSIVSNLAANESFISWMLYLEVGQVYSAREASELAQEAVLAAQQRPRPLPRIKPHPSRTRRWTGTIRRRSKPRSPPASRNRPRPGTSRDGTAASAQEPDPAPIRRLGAGGPLRRSSSRAAAVYRGGGPGNLHRRRLQLRGGQAGASQSDAGFGVYGTRADGADCPHPQLRGLYPGDGLGV